VTLCLDIGNSQLFGGVFAGEQLRVTFRKTSKAGSSSDEIGLFLRSVLRENDIDPGSIERVAMCSVVPEVDHSIRNACLKYFRRAPFVLQAGVKTGLKVRYKNPLEVGADRIANAIAASHRFAGRNLIVLDFGTATTLCAISKNQEYLGGVILAGVRVQMEALVERTSKLPAVEIRVAENVVGRSTSESIQSGLFHGSVGAIREVVAGATRECFDGERPLVIGTGGFATLFEKAQIFDQECPDLVLQGLKRALDLNV
jgi:type III pantothenate kinase